MRTPTSARVALRLAALTLALLGGSGCSLVRQTVGAYEIGPNGIARPQLRLREALAHDDFTTALAWREDDELLRELTVGVSSYYALQFARSATVLDSAALLADDRITKSLSREALGLVTNDLTRPYQARRTERLFIPYYGMLAFARLEQWEDAAVEARRLTALLQQYAPDRSEGERDTHATLHFLAASVFERAGDTDEASVSHRLARAIAPVMIDSMQAASNLANTGSLVVVVERGFVAHRATESLDIFIGDSSRPGRWSGHEARRDRDRDRDGDVDGDDGGYWLSVAFPSLRRSARATGDLQLIVDGVGQLNTSRVSAIVDDAVASDEARERLELVARATARAAAKYAVTKAVKNKKGETAGKIANVATSLLERADIRSWHLLPQQITLVRIPVEAGMHRAEVTVGDTRLEVGPVNVRAGATSIAAVRLWGEPARAYARR